MKHVTVRRFLGNAADGSGTEDVLGTEECFGVFMHLSLNLSREVQVNIGRFVTVEAKEGFKGNVVPFSHQFFSTQGTIFIRQVKSRAD